MAKLFEKKDPSEVRSVRQPVLLTVTEKEQIAHLAGIRKLPVADYMRRAALGRRADVDYQTDIVLALSEVVKKIRALRASMVAHGHVPPDDLLLAVINEAIAAMLRIEK